MVYTPFTNWKYDKNLYHRVQSGPQRTGDDLDLTDTYAVVGGSYIYASGAQQTWFGVNDQGADFGLIPVGPVNISGYLNTNWRAVPPAVSGYWTNYENVLPHASGLLDTYLGYRAQGLYSVAGRTVQTALSPQPGFRDFGTYTWFGAAVPDNQNYAPFNTPTTNSPYGYDEDTGTYTGNGITGGPGSFQRVRYPSLTNPTNDTSGSRAAWVYNYPVYCQVFTESVRSTAPGQMSVVTRTNYRGKSTRYVPNYGSIYGVLGEGVRGMIRRYSPGTNI